MLVKSISGSLVLLVALGACGSSGSGGGQDVEFELIESLQSRASTASDAQPEDLSGTATMSGYIGLNIDSVLFAGPVYGAMNMEADFNTGSVEARASDLGVYQDIGGCMSGCELVLMQSLEGELTFTPDDGGGIYDGTLFDGTLNGDLTSSTRNYEISIFADGGFLIDDEGLLASATLGGAGDEVIITSLDGMMVPESVNATGIFIVAD